MAGGSARVGLEHLDVVVDQAVAEHSARIGVEHLDVVVSNTHTHVFLAAVATSVSSATGDLNTHAIIPDPLRIPPHHVVKSLSARIVSRGGLFR